MIRPSKYDKSTPSIPEEGMAFFIHITFSETVELVVSDVIEIREADGSYFFLRHNGEVVIAETNKALFVVVSDKPLEV